MSNLDTTVVSPRQRWYFWKSKRKDSPYYKYCNEIKITSSHPHLRPRPQVLQPTPRIALPRSKHGLFPTPPITINPQHRIQRLCARLPIFRQELLQRSRRRLLVFLLYSTRCLRFSCSSAATVNLFPISCSGRDGAFTGNECVELLLDGSHVVDREEFRSPFLRVRRCASHACSMKWWWCWNL